MPFALYRVAKLKSVGAMRGSVSHTARHRDTPNSDPARAAQNEQLIGFDLRIPTPDAFIAEWEKRTRGVQRKPDAVLCQELFLGVSPSFFTDCAVPADRMHRLNEWKFRTISWLRDEFGERVFAATLHADETTPHICAYVIPIRVAKDGTPWLSAKHLFNRVTLRQQQDSYAAVLSDLGIERGLRGSKAKHQTVRQFYAQMETVKKPLPPVARIAEAVQNCVPEKGLLERHETYRQRVTKAVVRETQRLIKVAERAEIVTEKAAVEKSARIGIEATNRALSRQLSESQIRLKELTNQVRDIPLEEVMQRLGFGDPAVESAERVWRTGEHALSINGAKWYDHKAGKGGGKAIDLVMHVMGCDFREAVGWLAGQWSEAEATAAVRCAAIEQVRSAPKKDFGELWRYYAQPDAAATRIAQDYLIQERMIPAQVVERAISCGRIHGSFEHQRSGRRRTWCVFPHISPTVRIVGASLRATDSLDGPKRAIGSKSDGFFAIGPTAILANEIVLVESPIDALSYSSLYPKAHVVSIAGASVPDTILPILDRTTQPITLALDADQAGHQGWLRFLERIRGLGGGMVQRLRRLVPAFPGWPCKDWNDVLKAKALSPSRAIFASQTATEQPQQRIRR
ncbi:MAG: plasmid recombination protein [Opitutaceae bacterium]|nr:plasmid recombination protein [Opitutaceae bacterium]